jgi:hypothetical protein
MPWGPDLSGQPSYFVQFATPPPAQSSYVITTAIAGEAPSTWQLQATEPTFDGAVTSPANGAMVSANAPLAVTWPAQPLADYELTELFARSGGAWAQSYTSQQPLESAAAGETIPIGAPGAYLLNVIFAKASCPPSADGCVFANAVATAQLTAQ